MKKILILASNPRRDLKLDQEIREHFNLRLILYHTDRIPWNYARFLDFVSDRLLMKKVGGYIFIHRMLMEHLAE